MAREKDCVSSFTLLVEIMVTGNSNWTVFDFGISRFPAILGANLLVLLLSRLNQGWSPARVCTQMKEVLQSMSATCKYQCLLDLQTGEKKRLI
jgi:hypothetical protein